MNKHSPSAPPRQWNGADGGGGGEEVFPISVCHDVAKPLGLGFGGHGLFALHLLKQTSFLPSFPFSPLLFFLSELLFLPLPPPHPSSSLRLHGLYGFASRQLQEQLDPASTCLLNLNLCVLLYPPSVDKIR